MHRVVSLELRFLEKGSVADFTLKRFLSCVNQLVLLQVPLFVEGFATLVTVERSLSNN